MIRTEGHLPIPASPTLHGEKVFFTMVSRAARRGALQMTGSLALARGERVKHSDAARGPLGADEAEPGLVSLWRA